MATKKSVSSLKEGDLKGKRVFVRADLNVPLDDSFKITDDTRIRAAVPTIKYLMSNGARVILSSHLGRPKGVTPKYSLKPLVGRLSELLGVEVKMADDCIGPDVEKLVAEIPEGGVLLLENVRFYKEEEKNDPEFAKKLASLADLYVNDAFGTAHRAHASTEGVAKYLKPAVAGYLMQKVRFIFQFGLLEFFSRIMSFIISKPILILTTIFSLFQGLVYASSSHVISFRSPNLYPESVTYDRIGQHFVVGSLRHPTLLSVSDAGVVSTLVSDESLPANSSFLGVTVDVTHNRMLAVVYRHSEPSNCALAAYDLRAPHKRLFLATLYDSASSISGAGANDVAVDFSGNAFVTNSASNLIWKVDLEGKASVFSKSKAFTRTPVPDTPYSGCGLNGIAYVSNGYLLVTQTNTGKLYKVDSEDGIARIVQLNRELIAPDGLAIRRDGVLLVVSQYKLYFIKSDDSWSEGVVYDETALDTQSFPTSVTVGAENRVYVLYGHVKEGISGNSQRDRFSILEVRSEDESGDEAVWVYVLIGFGLLYFFVWRLQMRQLFTNMNKKVA